MRSLTIIPVASLTIGLVALSGLSGCTPHQARAVGTVAAVGAVVGLTAAALAAEPVYVEPQPVVLDDYPRVWYEGRWVYYNGGVWGYWAYDHWYAYPRAHRIYSVHRRPYRPVASYRYRHYRSSGPAHRGYAGPGRSRPARQRAAVRSGSSRRRMQSAPAPQRRGDRVRSQQQQQQQQQQQRRQSQSRSGSRGSRSGGGESRGEGRSSAPSRR